MVRLKIRRGEPLNPNEIEIINAFLYPAYRNGDLAYLQYERGVIDEERLRSGLGLLINLLYLPEVQGHWNRARRSFTKSYQEYIDKLIEDIGNVDDAEAQIEWTGTFEDDSELD